MRTLQKSLTGMVLFMLISSPADAVLVSRLSGAAYDDTVLYITWLADANAGAGSIYDGGSNTTDGSMTWASAQLWIASLNSANYLGVNNWRLPTVTDTGTSGCDSAYTGTDCGYNVDLSTSEMAHLFYSTPGNTGYYDTSGSPTGCSGTSPYCLSNDGPFSNLQPNVYWSGTTYAPDTSSAWLFDFYDGRQNGASKSYDVYAWAVRPGDIAPVPVPAALWMLGSALGVLGLVRRKLATGMSKSGSDCGYSVEAGLP
jgi:hypothetical protein